MNPAPEQFDRLRKLPTLKRHESPPPGYFNHFSDKIIARIEAEGLCARNLWWQRLFKEWDAKPVLACAYGLVDEVVKSRRELKVAAELTGAAAATPSAS